MASKQHPVVTGLVCSLVVAQLFFGVPIVAPTSLAQAQSPKPKVWMAPIQAQKGVSGAGLLARKFDEVTRTQLSKSQKVEMAGTRKVVSITAGESDPRVEEAERLRVAGKEAYQRKEYKIAFDQLKAALDRYEAALASVNKFEVIIETLGYLGATSIDLDLDGNAKEFFQQVVSTMPDAEPLDEYSPKAKKAFAKIRKKLLRKKRGTLKIVTDPPGAVVKIDGEEKGKSPVIVKGLVRGYHFIQSAHPEAGLAAKKVRVKGRKRATINLALSTNVGPTPPKKAPPEAVDALVSGVTENRLDVTFRAAARDIARDTQSNYVVVGIVEADGNGFVMVPYLYGASEEQVVPLGQLKFEANLASALVQAASFAKAVEAAVMEFPADQALVGRTFRKQKRVAPAVVAPQPRPSRQVTAETRRPTQTDNQQASRPSRSSSARSSSLPPQVVETLDDRPPRRRGTRWYKSWWFWTITGTVVAAGAGVGGYFLFRDDPKDDEFNLMVGW
ncbi:MAG: PEGA domain-containing protein [Myxococcota bacterium]|nr:PEGA domain-containing protein [Myxococcota bacterium]